MLVHYYAAAAAANVKQVICTQGSASLWSLGVITLQEWAHILV